MADAESAWRVVGELVGRVGKHGRPKPAADISGIACEPTQGFPRRCVLVDDEAQAAQVVILSEGQIAAGDTIRLNNDTLGDKGIEADGEGVAFADGYFYVIGSHGHPRDADGKLDSEDDADEIAVKLTAAGRVYRFKLESAAVSPDGRVLGEPEVERTTRLKEALAAIPEIAPAIDRRLEDGGVTIEGVAVRGDRLYAGLRGPLVDGRAAVASVSVVGLFDRKKPLETKLITLDLDGRGVRDLAPDRDGFLVLAGPTLTRAAGYAIYRWDGADQAKIAVDLGGKRLFGWGSDASVKPEAILPLGDGRVLVIADGIKDGAAKTVRLGE